MDETHYDLSSTVDKSGSRALVYKNPRLQRGYKKTVKPGRHVTGVYATNSAGEAFPPLYIFDSGAKIESNYQVKMSWLEGLPVIEGRFGCPDRVEVSSFYSVRSRGSMDDSLFNDYVERVVSVHLFTRLSQGIIAMLQYGTSYRNHQCTVSIWYCCMAILTGLG
jgi:hypothetical protein